MKSICMICHREILPDHRPGQRLPPAWGYSHGCCRPCVPEMCRRAGLADHQLAQMVAALEATAARSSDAQSPRVQREVRKMAV